MTHEDSERDENILGKKFRTILEQELDKYPVLSSRAVEHFILDGLNNDIFGPICREALKITQTYGREEIRAFLQRREYELLSFPAIAFLNEYGELDEVKQRALYFFWKTYDPTRESGQIPLSLQDEKEQIAQRKTEINQRLNASGKIVDENIIELREKRELLLRDAVAIQYVTENYDELEKKYADTIPKDSRKREIFLRIIGFTMQGKEYPSYEQSFSGERFYTMPIRTIRIDNDFEEHFIGDILALANWSLDSTVTTDLLTVANIMLEVLPHLKDLSEKIAYGEVDFVRSEVSRAKDSPFEYGLLVAYAEGIISIVQAINLALGQQVKETEQYDMDALVHLILRSNIPRDIARYLSLAVLGTTTLNAGYIRNLLIEKDGKLYVNPKKIETGKREKLFMKAGRGRRFGNALQSPEDYLGREIFIALSNQSGTLCPLALPTKAEGSSKQLPSYIEQLTGEFDRIYSIVRSLRQEGVCVN